MTKVLTEQERIEAREGLKKIFTRKVDGKTEHIAIMEVPKDLMEIHMINKEYVEGTRMDTRVLTMLFEINDKQLLAETIGYHADYIIGVYDYELFMSNKCVAEAIINHEIGHINNIPSTLYDAEEVRECEYQADEYAVRQVGKERVLLMLNVLRAELHRIENEHLASELTKRIINIRRYELPSEKKPVERKGLFSSVVGKLKELF